MFPDVPESKFHNRNTFAALLGQFYDILNFGLFWRIWKDLYTQIWTQIKCRLENTQTTVRLLMRQTHLWRDWSLPNSLPLSENVFLVLLVSYGHFFGIPRLKNSGKFSFATLPIRSGPWYKNITMEFHNMLTLTHCKLIMENMLSGWKPVAEVVLSSKFVRLPTCKQRCVVSCRALNITRTHWHKF